MWLMGGLKPDHKTISEFRRQHKKALKLVLKQCVRLCIKLDLIGGNVLFVDGTKIRANAARGKTGGRAHYEKMLKALDARIDQLLEECERIDQREEGLGSSVVVNQELAQAGGLKRKIKDAIRSEEHTSELQSLRHLVC